MPATEFEIVVSDRTVTGTFGRDGGMPTESCESDLEVDDLAIDTVELMARWLGFWRLIDRAHIRRGESLFESKTFEVVGRQLWRLILENDVGRTLVRHLDDPDDQPLRLVLTFTNRADTVLRGLPWEFLYHPRHWFLAGKTGLLLTRYVQLAESTRRPTITAVQQDQLRVLLLAALPNEEGLPPGEKRFAGEREDLTTLHRRLTEIEELDPLEPITWWDTGEVARVLADQDKPCHIVHVVGICKGPPGRPRLFLGGADGGFQDPRELVDRLCAGAHIPQLVVLQLCDYEDGDATENFERLAPALIERGVPAVLALQYAALAEEVGVGVDFYRSLIKGSPVGAAVQASRGTLAQRVDRRFATPVLYLGNDGALWRPQDPTQGSRLLGPPPARPPARGGERAVRERLAGVVFEARDLDVAQRRALLQWVDDLGLEGDPTTAARDLIRLALKGGYDDPTRDALGRMLDELRDRPRRPS